MLEEPGLNPRGSATEFRGCRRDPRAERNRSGPDHSLSTAFAEPGAARFHKADSKEVMLG